MVYATRLMMGFQKLVTEFLFNIITITKSRCDHEYAPKVQR